MPRRLAVRSVRPLASLVVISSLLLPIVSPVAAFAADAAFCVLSDARRHALMEAWFEVLSAVRAPALTPRLKLLTWQELAAVLPADLQHFLATKYGITP